MDAYKIDGHKLNYHINTVNKWLNGDVIYPIYMEISPCGTCNHRCTFCALDFMEYQKRYLSSEMLREKLGEIGQLGVKSIMYAGEGEPLLHKQISDIITSTKESGIDAAITTNGFLLKNNLAEKIIPDLEWIKISINAGTSDTYAKIHRTRSSDFDRVIRNLENAIEIKHKNNYKCTIGMQMLLLPENRFEVRRLAETARDIGVDYLVVKPYSQHLLCKTKIYNDLKYQGYSNLADELSALNTKKFNVIFRLHTMNKWNQGKRCYGRCLALPFWSYIDAGGNVWGCSAFLGDKRFLYGNIYESSFKEIWECKQRAASVNWVKNTHTVDECRVNCRMDEINRYLWELKNPPEHVNFI